MPRKPIARSRKVPCVSTVAVRRRNQIFVSPLKNIITRLPITKNAFVLAAQFHAVEGNTCVLIARPFATMSDFTRFTRADGLSGGLDLPTQEEIRGDSQYDEDKQESENVQSKVSVKHIQFL